MVTEQAAFARVDRIMLKPFSLPDLIALAAFILAWGCYAYFIERSPRGRRSLNSRMNRYRAIWIERLLARDMRMVDMQIMASLQNGTAFFASTSLLAVGGALTLLRSSEEVLSVMTALPLAIETTRELWQAKTIGLVVIFAYAFYKFGWSYRLFNYVVILVGAMPFAAEKDTPEATAHVRRTTKLFEAAGRHFNRGQRAIFFALGYLGWYIGPAVLMAMTAVVLVIMWQRQFSSDALAAVADHEPG
jgi:uncharacterized membrane protein